MGGQSIDISVCSSQFFGFPFLSHTSTVADEFMLGRVNWSDLFEKAGLRAEEKQKKKQQRKQKKQEQKREVEKSLVSAVEAQRFTQLPTKLPEGLEWMYSDTKQMTDGAAMLPVLPLGVIHLIMRRAGHERVCVLHENGLYWTYVRALELSRKEIDAIEKERAGERTLAQAVAHNPLGNQFGIQFGNPFFDHYDLYRPDYSDDDWGRDSSEDEEMAAGADDRKDGCWGHDESCQCRTCLDVDAYGMHDEDAEFGATHYEYDDGYGGYDDGHGWYGWYGEYGEYE